MIIYLITNKLNGKYYVGKTKGPLKERWYQHCHPQYHHLAVVKAIKKYGEQAFTIEVIATASSEEELNKLEKLWIILLRSYDSTVGYNMTFGGDGVSIPKTAEWKEKIKKSLIGRKPHGDKLPPLHVENIKKGIARRKLLYTNTKES